MNVGERNTEGEMTRARFSTGTTRGTGDIEETKLDDIRSRFETSVIGLIALTHAVIPGIPAQRGGCISNISSVAGLGRGFAAPVYRAATAPNRCRLLISQTITTLPSTRRDV
jgi:NAD(P)-dependent dehydrogenase (short-subunit alcohol dehydrogenase family)